jgi:hypothetical protein
MSLPDAAAEFARQFVIALAGDAGREDRTEREDVHAAELREVCAERDHAMRQHEKTADAMEQARAERDALRTAAIKVLDCDEARMALPPSLYLTLVGLTRHTSKD